MDGGNETLASSLHHVSPQCMTDLTVVSGHTEQGEIKRDKWSSKIQFLLGCMGFSIGLGNVWRFPYLCYRDGGGAFLIPYAICVLIGAIPMMMLEIAMGQYTSQGAITCWNLVPLFKGIGYASQISVSIQNLFYNVIMAWSLYYLFASFTTVLPWATCDNSWNTPFCRTTAHAYSNLNKNATLFLSNFSEPQIGEDSLVTETREKYVREISDVLGRNVTEIDVFILKGTASAVDPVTEFWQHKVLGLSSGVDQLGTVKWDLALCLLLAWIIVYFGIWKGVKWTGKILYVSTTMPYVFMLILLVRGVTLPGSLNGIKYYLYPDIHKLRTAKVWYGAASQVFFSYSICVGPLTALGSYNQFNHNFWRDGILFACINSGTSFLAGFIIFAVLGFMAHEHHVSIDQVAESGPGLAFIAYPKAVAQLPGAPAWSVLFFIMLILLGMDTQFGAVESFITAISDIFPRYLRRKYLKELFVAAVCIATFLLGLMMVTNGGMYVFVLFDYYGPPRIIIIAVFYCIAISWVYGVSRFCRNIELMLGRRLGPYLKVCWLVITPAFNVVCTVLCFYNYSDVTYNRTYQYPAWAIACGWAMVFVPISLIPFTMLWKITRADGTFLQRVRYLVTSQAESDVRMKQQVALKTETGVPLVEDKDTKPEGQIEF